jgi:hypothetical protein
MRAEQFIKDHGLERAREVVEGAPEGSTHFVGSTYLKLIGAVWWNAWLSEWNHKDSSMVKRWKCESIELIKTWGDVFKLDEIKRLVESVDLFKKLKTKKNANREFMKACMRGQTERANQIKRAIDAHDAIYGKKGASHE